MRTSEERVFELHRRMESRRKAKALHRVRCVTAVAAAVCIVLSVLVAVGVSRLPVQGAIPNPGATASIFAGRAALGFVLVALVAFFLGVVVTVLSYRLRRRAEEEEHDGRQD